MKPQAPLEQVEVEFAGCAQTLQRVPHELVASSGTQVWPHACWPVGQLQVALLHVAPMGQSVLRRQPVTQRRESGSHE